MPTPVTVRSGRVEPASSLVRVAVDVTVGVAVVVGSGVSVGVRAGVGTGGDESSPPLVHDAKASTPRARIMNAFGPGTLSILEVYMYPRFVTSD